MSSKGCITLPVEQGMDDLLKEIADKWGADAVRNSDGTELPDCVGDLGMEVYSTLSLTRADQNWAREHEEELTQKQELTAIAPVKKLLTGLCGTPQRIRQRLSRKRQRLMRSRLACM